MPDLAIMSSATAANATAAQASAGLSATFQGYAAANATVAQQQASFATANAASAAQSASIQATIGIASLNKNATFAQGWTSGSYPPFWSDWANGGASTIVAGQISPNAIRFVTAAGQNKGIRTPGYVQAPTPPGFYVLEGTVTLESGSLSGAGILAQFFNAAGGGVEDASINFATDTDATGAVRGAGSAGLTYRFSKLVRIVSATITQTVLYAMSGYEGLATVAAKTLVFHSCVMRPANSAEIALGLAIPTGSTLSATITELKNADANLALNKADASRVTTLEAKAISMPNLIPNSDFSGGKRFWTNGDAAQWGIYYNEGVGSYVGLYGQSDYRYIISENILIGANTTYSLSFNGDGGTSVGQDGTAVYMSQYDAAGAYIPAGDAYCYIPVTTRNWGDRLSASAVSHANARSVRVVIRKGVSTDSMGISRLMLNLGGTAINWSDQATVRNTIARVDNIDLAFANGSVATASSVSTIAARLGKSGGNLLTNTDFQSGVGGWLSGGQVVTPIQVNYPTDDNWHPVGENTIGFNVAGSAGYSDVVSNNVSVEGGKFYGLSCHVAAHRANANMYVGWYNASGTNLGFNEGPGEFVPGSGGRNLSDFTRRWTGPLQAPAGAAYAVIIFRKFATNSGSDSWLWLCRPMFSECAQFDVAPPPYTPGNARQLTALITDARQVAVSAQGRIEASAGLSVNAGGQVAAMRIYASSGDYNTTSIDFLASSVRIWSPDQNTGVAPFEVRNGGVRMKSAFVDRLSVGTSITLGSGIQFKVAVQPIDINVTDGQVVNFGYDLGNNPSLAFYGNNLAPLSAGETYRLYAENLTPTGFTARLKISTPAAPTNLATGFLGANANGPTSHHIHIDGYGGRSTTGGYNVRVNGYNRVYSNRVSGGSNQPIYEPDDPSNTIDGYTYITVFGYNGAAWVELDVIVISPPFNAPNGYSDQAFDVTQSVPTGTNVSHIGVAVSFKSFPQSYVGAMAIDWQTQGSGGGLRSATPSGQVSTVTVRPKT